MKNESLPITPEAVDTTNPDVINETYTNLNNKYHKLYQFVMNYSEYIYSRHDYANNKVPLTMVEVHTLSYIEDHPALRLQSWSPIGRKQRARFLKYYPNWKKQA